MGNKPEKSNKRTNQLINGLIIIGLSVLLFLILVGVFGKAGEYVSNFFIGVFGYAVYGYTLSMILVGFLLIIGWSAKDTKLGVKLSFGLLIAIIVAMCHIGASRELAGLSYGEYLKQCYLLHSTAGGVLGGVIFYPLTKVYLFSMIFLGLIVAGLVALLIVMHINYELIIPSKNNKVKVFNKNNKHNKNKNNKSNNYDVYDSNPYYQASDEENTEPERVLYNGTITGKSLPDSFNKGKNTSVLGFTPIEEIDSFEIQEEEKEEKKRDKNKKIKNRDNLSEIQQEAIKVLYDTEDMDVQYRPPVNKSVDVSNSIKSVNKYKKSEIKQEKIVENKNEEIKDVQKNTEKPLSDRYKSYTNNFRRNQMLENMGMGSLNEQNDIQNDQDIQSDEDFINDIEKTLNQALNENKIESEDAAIDNNEVNNIENSLDDKIELDTPKETTSTYQQIDLGDIDKPRENDKYKVDENKIRENRFKELREKAHEEYIAPKSANNYKQENKEVVKNNIVENKVEVKEEVKEKEEKKPRIIKPYIAPSIDMLEDYSDKKGSYDDNLMKAKCDIFESKMREKGVDVEVTNVVKGPTFSRIEFKTNSTLSKVISHTNDISMWLAVRSMRLEAPIPGRDCCGIEIPNDEENRGMVGLRDIIESKKFQNVNTEEGVYFALGQDIDGNDYVANICDFPHALIAGGTGSGKSVCINCMLVSMLYKYSPEELRFILVDPKVVELNKYKNIPHLLIPEIINDSKKVIKALKWLCVEMDRRYSVLETVGVSNLEQYNQCVEQKDKLPNIVCIIDEVGDIMCSPVKKDFESLVQKLTQKARAAGIYLILATQRPSVDVITGTIKINLPTRIAFAVAAAVDSRTILDTVGAEKLLGRGDMLYKQNGKPSAIRIQGAFVHPREIKRVVDEVRAKNDVYYDESAYEAINKVDEEPQEEGKKVATQCAFMDELCPDILRFVAKEKDFSTSKIQRVFSIGFNRAANIYEWMEAQGYCEDQGNKKHALITEEQAEEIIINTENNAQNNND